MESNNNVSGDIYQNQLLALATSAKGDEPMDTSVKPMSEKDREWLRTVLRECAADADPIKKIKRILSQMEALISSIINEDLTENEASSSSATQEASAAAGNASSDENLKRFQTLVDEDLVNLVCDMDTALDFCQLGGLEIVRRLLASSKSAYADSVVLGLVAELAQYNPEVQELVLKQGFCLDYCLNVLRNAVAAPARLADEEPETRRCLKVIAAISGILKGYIPAAGKFARLNGPQTFCEFFDYAMRKDRTRLVHRCAVAAKSISGSFKPEVSEALRLAEMASIVQRKLEETDPVKYEESLEFMRE